MVIAGRGSCAGLGWGKYCFFCFVFYYSFFFLLLREVSIPVVALKCNYVPMDAVPHTHSNGNPPQVSGLAKDQTQECQVDALICFGFIKGNATLSCVCILPYLC